MHKAKKVLLFYITNRSGHHSAALALKRAFELKHPGTEVQCINAFQYAFPFAERIIHCIYLFVIKRVPGVWASMYDNPKVVARSKGIKKFIHDLGVSRLKNAIERFKPDAIACTQAFPCGLVADYKKEYKLKIPLIGVLTDFAPHSFWVYSNVDYYIVPSSEGRDLLTEKGVPQEKIKILGIPIDPKFAISLDRNEICGNYGLNPEIPIVLLMGGGHGLGPIRAILKQLDLLEIQIQLIVVCGLNNKLYSWISKYPFTKKIITFKFTDQVERLMAVAQLIITKPGGITTAESLAKRIPMIIVNPIPGQEARNTQFLVKSGVAIKIDNPCEISEAVKKTLNLKSLSFLGDLAKPQAASDIADFILSLC